MTMRSIIRYTVVAFSLLILMASPVLAREITDMIGRRVTVPEKIGKVVALSPPGTYLVYAIDPSLLAGLNFPLWQNEKRYTTESFRRLPVIGGMVGEGRNLNMEVLLKVKPDVAIFWSFGDNSLNREFERKLRPLGIPIVYVRFDSLRDYPEAIRFMGDLLNRRDRALKLCRYADEVLRKIDRAFASYPLRKRVPVYYSEGGDGLATEGERSMHTEIIPLAGGENVHKKSAVSAYGMERISLEQLLLYNPEVVIVKEKPCVASLLADPRWHELRAVRNRKVYLIPSIPFNWFDRPPSFMRLLGVQWLANLLHPDLYPIDMAKETKRFYRLFLGIELGERDVQEILRE
jgi:iron complex transport system substrate-binding protein